MIFYPRYLPVAGFTPFSWLMFIRKDCRDNVPLIKHEEVHQRQMREDGWFVFVFRYLFSRKWRQYYEVEAYRTQIAAGASLDGCAALLAGRYWLDLSVENARLLLK